jgi:hypothetical protein
VLTAIVARAGGHRAAIGRFLSLLLLIAVLGGCATTQTATQIDRLQRTGEKPRILLMTPDVKYFLWTASGITELQAEWTEAARKNFLDATQNFAARRNADVVVMGKSVGTDELVRRYENLHAAVGNTILVNHFGIAKLPSKAGAFDWSLGSGVSEIAERYSADYALFVFYRDYQSSGGRIAMSILVGALGGSMGTQAEFGFASLVDLKSGDVVWFNKVDVGAGELRDAGGAAAVVNKLFEGLPAD